MVIKEYAHAIIGCGRIAPIHIKALQDNGVSSILLCDIDTRKAKALTPAGDQYFNDYQTIPLDMLDSVSVCTGHDSHIEISKYFLSRGVSVLCEKPLSVPSYEIGDFLKICRRDKSAIFSVVAQHRYDSIVKFVKKLISSGRLGQIVLSDFTLYCNRPNSYYSESSWRGKKESEGGSVLINQAYHLLDLIVFLFGTPQDTHSFLSTHFKKNVIETEETACAFIEYPTHSVTLKATVCSNELWYTRIDIVGTLGMISFSIDEPFRIFEYSKSIEEDVTFFLRKDKKLANKKGDLFYFGHSHELQIRAFIKSVQSRERILLPSIEEIEKTQNLIQKLYL